MIPAFVVLKPDVWGEIAHKELMDRHSWSAPDIMPRRK
jgi:hypothetical protein